MHSGHCAGGMLLSRSGEPLCGHDGGRSACWRPRACTSTQRGIDRSALLPPAPGVSAQAQLVPAYAHSGTVASYHSHAPCPTRPPSLPPSSSRPTCGCCSPQTTWCGGNPSRWVTWKGGSDACPQASLRPGEGPFRLVKAGSVIGVWRHPGAARPLPLISFCLHAAAAAWRA